MVEIKIESGHHSPSTSKNVHFRESGGGPTEEELEVIRQFRAIMGDQHPDDKILRVIRKHASGAKMDMNELVNNVMDTDNQDEDIDIMSPATPPRVIGCEERPQQAEPATPRRRGIPYNNATGVTDVLDKEESEMQMAIINSMHQHANSNSLQNAYRNSLPHNLEELVRDPLIPTGLYNSGNTCWFNCVAQVLYNLPEFRQLLFWAPPFHWTYRTVETDTITPMNVRKRDLLVSMRRLFAEMVCSAKKYIDTSDVLVIVDALHRQGSSDNLTILGTQQDASESLFHLIDYVENSIKDAQHERLHPPPEDDWIPKDAQIPPVEQMDVSPPPYEPMPDLVNSTSAVARPQASRANSPIRMFDNNKGTAFTRLPTQTGPKIVRENVKTEDESIVEAMDTVSPDSSSLVPAAVDTNSKNGPPTLVAQSQVSPSFASPVHPPDANGVAVKQRRVLLPKSGDDKLMEESTSCSAGDFRPEGGPMFLADQEKEYDERMPFSVEEVGQRFDEIFTAEMVTTREGDQHHSTQRSSPQIFNLQVQFGNIHDALEAHTFDTSRSTGHIENWCESLPQVIFMSLSRFKYDKRATKIHQRFTFPRSIYMDRYLRKNASLVQCIRERRRELRDELAITRSRLQGLEEYPLGFDGKAKVADVLESVLKMLRLEEMPENSPSSSGGDCSKDDNESSFVADLGKKLPVLEEELVEVRLRDGAAVESCEILLENMRATALNHESHLREAEQILMDRIEDIYSIPELEKNEYSLHAVIIHSGEADTGHYWTYSRAITQGETQGELWYNFNDQHVSTVDWKQVERDAYGTGSASSSSAYCLVYVRSDAPWLLGQGDRCMHDMRMELPPDLREFMNERNEDFGSHLKTFRENESQDEMCDSANGASLATVATSTSDEIVPDEDDQTATDVTRKVMRSPIMRNVPLYQQSGYTLSSKQQEDLYKIVDQLQNDVTIPPKSVMRTEDSIWKFHCRNFMQDFGFQILNELLGYDAKTLTAVNENDIDRLYKEFVGEYFKNVQHFKDNRSATHFGASLLSFLKINEIRLHSRVFRYALVCAMLESGSNSPFRKLALDEFKMFKQMENSRETISTFTWASYTYEMMAIAWRSLRSAYEVMSTEENNPSAEKLCFGANAALMCAYYQRKVIVEVVRFNPHCSDANVLPKVHIIDSLLHMHYMLLRHLLDNLSRKSEKLAPGINEVAKYMLQVIKAIRIYLDEFVKSDEQEFSESIKKAVERSSFAFELLRSLSVVTVDNLRDTIVQNILRALLSNPGVEIDRPSSLSYEPSKPMEEMNHVQMLLKRWKERTKANTMHDLQEMLFSQIQDIISRFYSN